MNTQRRQRQGFPSSVVRHGRRSGEVVEIVIVETAGIFRW